MGVATETSPRVRARMAVIWPAMKRRATTAGCQRRVHEGICPPNPQSPARAIEVAMLETKVIRQTSMAPVAVRLRRSAPRA